MDAHHCHPADQATRTASTEPLGQRSRRRRVVAAAAALTAAAVLGGGAAVADPGERPDRPRHRAVNPTNAPAAIGPYSQGVSTGKMLFVSGQLPLDPASGTVTGTDITAQTRQSLENITAVLEADGMDAENVTSTTVYLANLDHFAAFNAAYAEYFNSATPPARATVQVARLPRGALVEISAIAVR